MAVKTLENIGIEVSEDFTNQIFLSQEEKIKLQKGLDNFENGKFHTHQ